MEKTILLNVGRNNFVSSARILSITTWESAAVKKIVQHAKENNFIHYLNFEIMDNFEEAFYWVETQDQLEQILHLHNEHDEDLILDF